MKRKFRIKRDYNLFARIDVFIIQVKVWWFWVDVKVIVDKDVEYAKSCAEEVLYYLEREE